ncbi:MAG: DUF2652 domain-containing protein [Desulfobacteraceae bacterium]|nr:MAG: DUF2652 domain-containing protein [Desulfobacteraceae bacterium]
MKDRIERGFIVLADISGFTSFMERTEIAHSATILQGLINLIIQRFSPVLHIAEVEGDAVFAYVPESRITRGELLLELIEATYADYRDRQQTMQHNAGCPCRACQAIHTLDLKFVTHHGEYILQDIAGKRKPVGASVNLVHRLLKNNINAVTGWRGYALFSQPSLENMRVHPDVMRYLDIPYEFGVVPTGIIDLNARYNKLLQDRRVFLSREEADLSTSYTFNALPPVVWDWLTDPRKRKHWVPHSNLSVEQQPLGRTGPSTRYHCSTSDVIEEIVDWRPFKYYTVYLIKGRFKIMITSELEPVESGTHIRWNMKWCGPLSRMIGRPVTRFFANKKFQLKENFERLAQLAADVEKPERPGDAAAASAYRSSQSEKMPG